MDGFSIGRLPGSARAMLREMPDEHSMRLGHEASIAEVKAFWKSLDADQTAFVAKLFRRVMDDDDPAAKAAVYFGNAETMLHVVHERCMCGDQHRDPDDLLQELILRGSEREAEDEACDLYNLRRVPIHDMDGSKKIVFACLGCGHTFDSIDQRREGGEPGKCPGCAENE